jgi:hypothetical protein
MRFGWFFALLLWTCSLNAGVTRNLQQSPLKIQKYMLLSADVYNSGYWCRNAAAQVVLLAVEEGADYRVPRYWSDKEQTVGHTFPVVWHRGSWYAIDSVLDKRRGKYIPRSIRLGSYDPVKDMDRLSNFSGRPLLEYKGEASVRKIEFWFEEAEILGALQEELASLRKKVNTGEKALRIMEKQVPGLWEIYQRAIKKHRTEAKR